MTPPPHVLLPARLHQQLVAAAQQARPREFVATLGGRRHASTWCIELVLPLPNVAIAADRFEVAPAAFATAEAELRRRQLAWLGFVHSHADGSSALSRVDHELLWRHCLQLVVGVGNTGIERVQCHWGDALGFRPLPLAVAAAAAS